MLRRLMVLLAALAFFMARPGVLEAFENAVHLSEHGHGAHGAHTDGDEGEPHGDIEHGCVGGHHVCPCCPPVPMAPASVELGIVLSAPARLEILAVQEGGAGPPGETIEPFRPPIG